MKYLDQYKHLDEYQPFSVELTVDRVAERLVNLNYGVHRVLSAIVRYRLERNEKDELALGIKALLEKGLY